MARTLPAGGLPTRPAAGSRRGRRYTRAVADESPELFDDIYLGLRAGGAARKQRRGEPLSVEEKEAIGRWQRLSLWRKFIAIGAFALGTFGLGFTVGGLIFGRWRTAQPLSVPKRVADGANRRSVRSKDGSTSQSRGGDDAEGTRRWIGRRCARPGRVLVALAIAAPQKDTYKLTANLKARFEVPRPTGVPVGRDRAVHGEGRRARERQAPEAEVATHVLEAVAAAARRRAHPCGQGR